MHARPPDGARRKTAQNVPIAAMILSMTGFAAVAEELPGAALAVELRSVNHRYLDLAIRLPDELRMLEPALRERIAAELKRGKVECRVTVSRREGAGTLSVDPARVQELVRMAAELRKFVPDATPLTVADAEFPALSVQAPDADWPAPSLLSTTAASQESMPESASRMPSP